MKKKPNWPRIIYITGIVALLIGLLDPLEGSLVIAPGALVICLGSFLLYDRYLKWFVISAILIWIGVGAMFWISNLGGFGGESGRSWWWGLYILPYPIGWLLAVTVLIVKAVRKAQNPV
jgi:hypothetical protein